MQIAYDPDKDAANRFKHGVSLAFGARVFEDDEVQIIASIRVGDGEDRFKAVGSVDGRLWTAVHVRRGDTVRFVSVRRSNDGEQRDYHRPSGGPG